MLNTTKRSIITENDVTDVCAFEWSFPFYPIPVVLHGKFVANCCSKNLLNRVILRFSTDYAQICNLKPTMQQHSQIHFCKCRIALK
jgi:hypothetical protein